MFLPINRGSFRLIGLWTLTKLAHARLEMLQQNLYKIPAICQSWKGLTPINTLARARLETIPTRREASVTNVFPYIKCGDEMKTILEHQGIDGYRLTEVRRIHITQPSSSLTMKESALQHSSFRGARDKMSSASHGNASTLANENIPQS